MFINFWYPAEESGNVTGQPLKVQLLGLNFVLWRDTDGRAHCVHNTCAHRGGSLGDGKIVGNCLQCPYHGWLFNSDGTCQRIPSLGPLKSIPARSRIDSYPVDERYGLVFVFLGDLPPEQRPTILEIPEYGDSGWRTVRKRYRWKANYVRLIENQSDPSHVEYVHAGFGMAGKRPDYNVPKISVQETQWGAGAMTEFTSPELPDQEMKKLQGPGAQRVDAGSGFHAISTTWTHIHFNATDRMHIYLFAVPRGELDLEIFLINLRNCMLDEQRDRNFLDRIGVAVEEDRIVIEKLDPPIPSKDAIGEFIVPADDVLMAYRARLADWQSRGWRMDLDTMAGSRGRVAYAIASPARREHPSDWAVTAVPLLDG